MEGGRDAGLEERAWGGVGDSGGGLWGWALGLEVWGGPRSPGGAVPAPVTPPLVASLIKAPGGGGASPAGPRSSPRRFPRAELRRGATGLPPPGWPRGSGSPPPCTAAPRIPGRAAPGGKGCGGGGEWG